MKKFLLLKFIIIFMTKDSFGWLFDPTKPIEFDSNINIRGSLYNHGKGFTLNSTVNGTIQINNNDMENFHDNRYATAIKNIDSRTKFNTEVERFKAMIKELIRADEKSMTHDFGKNTKMFIDYLEYSLRKSQSEEVLINIENTMKEILEILKQVFGNSKYESQNKEAKIIENLIRRSKLKTFDFGQEMKEILDKLFRNLKNGKYFDFDQLFSEMEMSMKRRNEYFKGGNKNISSILKSQGIVNNEDKNKKLPEQIGSNLDLGKDLNEKNENFVNLESFDNKKELTEDPSSPVDISSISNNQKSLNEITSENSAIPKDINYQSTELIPNKRIDIESKNNPLNNNQLNYEPKFPINIEHKTIIEGNENSIVNNHYLNGNCIDCSPEHQSRDSNTLNSNVKDEKNENKTNHFIFSTESIEKEHLSNSKGEIEVVNKESKMNSDKIDKKSKQNENSYNTQSCSDCDNFENDSLHNIVNNNSSISQQKSQIPNEKSDCSDCDFKINAALDKIEIKNLNESSETVKCTDCEHNEKSKNYNQSISQTVNKMQMNLESNEEEMKVLNHNGKDVNSSGAWSNHEDNSSNNLRNKENFQSTVNFLDNEQSVINGNSQEESLKSKEKLIKNKKRLEEISKNLKQENFNENDLIKIENYRNEISDLMEYFKNTNYYKNSKAIHSELLGLIKALEVIRIASGMVNSNGTTENLQHIEILIYKLNGILNSIKNQFVRENAKQLKILLQEEFNKIKKLILQEEEILYQIKKINETIHMPENNNLIFLNTTRHQLTSIMMMSKNIETIENAKNLLQEVEILKNEIYHVQLELKQIESNIKIPTNETELKELTVYIQKLSSMRRKPEQSIYNKAIELDESIKKVIKEYQIKEVNLALDKMNVSLETAQSGNEINNNMMKLKNLEMKIESLDENDEEHSKDIEKVKQSISQLKRSLPMKSAKAAIRNNARVLYTIVNESINIMNATQSDIDNLNNQFLKLERLNSSRFDLTSLNSRKNIIINDYNRISNDLSDIREKLELLGFTKTNVNEDKIIKAYNDTSEMMEILVELDNLLRHSSTSKLYKETIRNVQEIEQLKGSIVNTFKTIGRLQNLENKYRMNQSRQTESLIESYSTQMEQEKNDRKLIKNNLRSVIIDNTSDIYYVSSPSYQSTLNKQQFNENENLNSTENSSSSNYSIKETSYNSLETNLELPITKQPENEFSSSIKDYSSTTITSNIQSSQQPTITTNTMNDNEKSSTNSSEATEIYNNVVYTDENAIKTVNS